MGEEGLLAPYRVLDLTNEKGNFCGRLLADLGADVILVEPPGGCSSRRVAPFHQDDGDREHSLFFWAYNLNKRGITLDIGTDSGRALFARLVEQSDFVIESFAPGYLDGLSVGYAQMSALKPDIVVTSISGFGQSGPKRDYLAPDIVGMALGGIMALTGDSDRPPVRISAPQAWLQASGQAFGATMLAHYYRALSGKGQHVDVSMQQSVTTLIIDKAPTARPDFSGMSPPRTGARRERGGVTLSQVFPCKNGYVSFYYVGGRTESISTRKLVDIMDAAGLAPGWLKNKDWDNWTLTSLTQAQDGGQVEANNVEAAIIDFFMTKTPSELYDLAVEHGLLLAPLSSVELVTQDRQLAARDFWRLVEHENLPMFVTYPGPFVQGSMNPARFYRRPPCIGEHNEEVYGDSLGVGPGELDRLRQAGVI